ncbi:MAG: phosphate regulon sensor histidine kinase PhoR [Pseudomonadales bacterium]|jgi:two-component system phosphate regulon sensor histidine kinase PhoR|nr:phosphate regulon sensor histidine kinase PhoR [Pseudomonadales bacterium]
MSGWSTEYAWLAIAILVGAAAGALAGDAWAGAFLGLLLLVLLRMRALHRLEAWLPQSLGRPPRLRGVLDDLAYRIWRQRRAGRERSRRLARIVRQLQQATNALPDAAVLLDEADGIVWFNEASAGLLHLERRDLGRSISSLLRSPEVRQLLATEDQAASTELPSPIDDSITLDLRLVPYTEGQRVLLFRDVTQIARLRRMRQDFIANVSHELRTPLTVVIGYLEALDDETDEALLRSTLRRLRRPAARMKSLVEDLLLLSRLDTAPPPEAEALAEIEIAALVRRIRADAEALSDAGHVFELDLDDDLVLRGLDVEVHSALSNLIVNAVRYSPEGGRIRVSWRREGDGARFTVRDEGLGIAEEHLPRLTERFYRIDVGRSRDAGGTGLGLAIVKHVLRRHGSALEIESALGRGSTFSCRFEADRIGVLDRDCDRGLGVGLT